MVSHSRRYRENPGRDKDGRPDRNPADKAICKNRKVKVLQREFTDENPDECKTEDGEEEPCIRVPMRIGDYDRTTNRSEHRQDNQKKIEHYEDSLPIGVSNHPPDGVTLTQVEIS